MKIKLFFALLFGSTSVLLGQNISLSTDTVNLGVVYENQPDSAVVYLINSSPTWNVFAIENGTSFPYYGDTVVSFSYNNKLVQPGDSIAIWLKASPEHNLMHKGSIVLETGVFENQIIIPYKFQGRYSKTYYSATENKNETALRSQLKSTITSGYTSLSYNVARDNMYGTLDNVNGDVECVYTGRTATFNTRAGATSNSFNCEHTFPQGFFSSASPMKSDIHHLFPTDITSNSQRGSLPFGVVSNPTWQNGGSKKNSSYFEPRDVHKGTTARAMMYFVLRYQDYANHFVGQESLLRQWHTQYPPSSADIARNNGIYGLQNNRNPFVDYPQFIERITSLVGSTSAVSAPAAYNQDTARVVYQTASSSNDTLATYIVNYGNVPLSISNFQLSGNMNFASGSGVATTLAPGHALKVEIEYPLNSDHSGETLTYSTTPSVAGVKTVYFQSDVPVFTIYENAWQPNIVFQNDRISWEEESAEFNWQILDLSGRVLAKGRSKQASNVTLPSFATGNYVFTAQSIEGTFSTKFFVTKH